MRKPARRVDLLGVQRHVYHRGCDGEVLLFGRDSNDPMYRCTECWGKRGGGFWRLRTLDNWNDEEMGVRFEVDDTDSDFI